MSFFCAVLSASPAEDCDTEIIVLIQPSNFATRIVYNTHYIIIICVFASSGARSIAAAVGHAPQKGAFNVVSCLFHFKTVDDTPGNR